MAHQWKFVNGQATCETRELLAVAQSMLDDAAVTRGGKAAGFAA